MRDGSRGRRSTGGGLPRVKKQQSPETRWPGAGSDKDARPRARCSRRGAWIGDLRRELEGPEGCPKNSGLSAALILMAFDESREV